MAVASERKVDRRVVRTRNAIMDAFDKLVVERGLDKLTVSAIAREADIDRKTFYLHYSSVTDLVNQRTELALGRIIEALQRDGEGKSATERVHIALTEVNQVIIENLAVYENIASSISIEQGVEQLFETIALTLEHRGIEIEGAERVDCRMRAQFYIAGATSLYITWLTSDHTTPIETVSDTIELAIQEPVFPTMCESAQ